VKREARAGQAPRGARARDRLRAPPPHPASRTNWTRLVPPSRTKWKGLVPPPVLTGHVSSLPPVLTGRVTARTGSGGGRGRGARGARRAAAARGRPRAPCPRLGGRARRGAAPRCETPRIEHHVGTPRIEHHAASAKPEPRGGRGAGRRCSSSLPRCSRRTLRAAGAAGGASSSPRSCHRAPRYSLLPSVPLTRRPAVCQSCFVVFTFHFLWVSD